MFRAGRWLVLGLIVAASTACATTQAKSATTPLSVPAPPPRLVIPAPIDPPSSLADLTTGGPVVLPPAPRAHDPAPPVKPADRTASVPVPVPPPAADPPPAVLQTTSNVGEVAQRAKDLLSSANRDLGHVDVRSLGTDARAQYDQARKFVALAQDALKGQNYVYARELAEKAAALASQLPKAR